MSGIGGFSSEVANVLQSGEGFVAVDDTQRAGLEKYQLDEDLSDFDRIVHLLDNGDSVQVCSALRQIVRHADDLADVANAYDKIIEICERKVSKWEPEEKEEFCRAFSSVIGELNASQSTQLWSFIERVLTKGYAGDREEYKEWGTLAVNLVQNGNIPNEKLTTDVLEFANARGEPAQSVSSHILCCRLLGALCTALTAPNLSSSASASASSSPTPGAKVTGHRDYGSDSAATDASDALSTATALHKQLFATSSSPSTGKTTGTQPTAVGTIVSTALSHCQDPDYEVRTCMCDQLPLLVRAVHAGGEVDGEREREVVEELKELLDDEERMVKAHAFQSLIEIYPHFSPEFRKSSLLGVVLALYDKVSIPSDVLEPMLQQIGKVFVYIVEDCEEDSRELDNAIKTMLGVFKRYCNAHEKDLRVRCAYNLPAIVYAVSAKRYPLHVHQSLLQLAQDQSPEVRRIVAAGLHEIAALLGPEKALHYTRETLLTLLRDSEDSVKSAMREKVPQYVQSALRKYEFEENRPFYDDLISTLPKPSSLPNLRWRTSLSLLSILHTLLPYAPTDPLFDSWLPAVSRLLSLSLSAAPVRERCAEFCAELSRYLRSPSMKGEYCKRVVEEFTRSKSLSLPAGSSSATALQSSSLSLSLSPPPTSAQTRLSFLRITANVLRRTSRRIFREIFFDALVEMARDSVPNVRRRVAMLLVSARLALEDSDVPGVTKCTEALGILSMDIDPDVSEAAMRANYIVKEKLQERDRSVTGKIAEDVEAEEREKEEQRILQKLQESLEKRGPRPASGKRSGLTKPESTNSLTGMRSRRTGRPATKPSSSVSLSKRSSESLVTPTTSSTPASGASTRVRRQSPGASGRTSLSLSASGSSASSASSSAAAKHAKPSSSTAHPGTGSSINSNRGCGGAINSGSGGGRGAINSSSGGSGSGSAAKRGGMPPRHRLSSASTAMTGTRFR